VLGQLADRAVGGATSHTKILTTTYRLDRGISLRGWLCAMLLSWTSSV
jgi:hypothetical protein